MSVCVCATVRLCAAAVCLCAAVCSAPGLRTFPAEAYCYVCPHIMKETWTSRRWKQFALALLCDVSCCCVSASQATSRNSRNVSLLLLRRPCLGCVPMGVACVAASVLVACFLQESAPTCYKKFPVHLDQLHGCIHISALQRAAEQAQRKAQEACCPGLTGQGKGGENI